MEPNLLHYKKNASQTVHGSFSCCLWYWATGLGAPTSQTKKSTLSTFWFRIESILLFPPVTYFLNSPETLSTVKHMSWTLMQPWPWFFFFPLGVLRQCFSMYLWGLSWNSLWCRSSIHLAKDIWEWLPRVWFSLEMWPDKTGQKDHALSLGWGSEI